MTLGENIETQKVMWSVSASQINHIMWGSSFNNEYNILELVVKLEGDTL